MSILSTSSRLIKVGQEYSAGSGISIDDYIISVTSVPGTTYSAGDNITIEDNIINSKDWSQDIANASANAYNAATAEIPAPFDPSFISGQIDNKLDTTAFTAWQSGQYATDLQTIEGQINNKLNESAFSSVSASFLTDINIPESATWNEVSQAYEQASGTYLTSHQSLDGYATEDWVTGQGYITGVDIPESATWQDVSTTVQTNSAQWAEGGTGGDEEVNSFVYDNSATINDVNSSYQENSGSWNNKLDASSFSSVSGNFITALPEDLVYTNDLTGYLSTSSTGSFRTKASIFVDSSGIGPLGFPSEYTFLTQNKLVFTSANFPPTQVQVDAGSVNNWNSNYNTVTSNSSNWNGITVYQTNSATYLTSHQDLSDYYTTAEANTLSSMFSGAIDYVSANAGDQEVSNVVQSNSGTWNTVSDKLDTSAIGIKVRPNFNYVTAIGGISISALAAGIANNARYDSNRDMFTTAYAKASALNDKLDTTAFSTVSGDFLTAINIPDSATWNEVSNTVQSNSAQWADGGTGDEEVNSFVYDNSATINEVNTTYQQNSAKYITAHQSLDGYATEDWVTAQGYITGVDLSEYAKRDFVLSSIESATSGKLDVSSFASVSSDFLTTSFEIPESAAWNDSTYITQTNSSVWNNVTGKQDSLSFHYLEI